ncbi:unnamed protein product, partial [Mycena citricolor]
RCFRGCGPDRSAARIVLRVQSSSRLPMSWVCSSDPSIPEKRSIDTNLTSAFC